MTSLPNPGPQAGEALPVSTTRLMRRLFAYKPLLFFVNLALWATFHSLPLGFGYFAKLLFDRLEQNTFALAWLALAGFGLVRLARFGVFAVAFRTWISLWYMLDALLRRNMLGYLLTARGARRLPDTPAEAVSRFRDDVESVAEYTEYAVDATGILLFALIAIVVMARIDPLVTLVVVAPLLGMVLLVRKLSPTIRAYRRSSREATARVTDFVGEAFGAVGTVKLAAREDQLVAHLQRLGATRRAAALRDVLLTELIRSVNSGMVNVGIGFVLLLAAAQFRSGSFTVGDFALFAAYLPRVAQSMTFLGGMFAQHRRTGVSFERMTRLLQDANSDTLVERHDLHLRGALPDPPPPPAREALQELRVEGLGVRFEGGRGVQDVGFSVRRGQFVVITGRIGSGKTTLLRALLGLTPAEGRVWWNGREVQDRASFFVPPRSAYTGQLPQLFSDTLRENVLQGARAQGLERALDLSVLRPDLAALERGLDTTVGARGVKLSGGQVSRSAAARMFAREAELLVFDDLSSALDAETERVLWDNVFGDAPGNVTCLVVSHRRAALLRADHILVLHEGRVADAGKLGELLTRSAEMRALWAEELDLEDRDPA